MTEPTESSEEPDMSTTTSPPAEGAAPQAARPPLTRSRSSRMVGGVAGGLGRHLNIDPLLIRLAFVLLTFAGGAGIPLYAAAWLLVPEEGAPASLAESALRGHPSRQAWLGIALVVLGVALLPPLWSGDPALIWGLVLIAAGVILYRSESTVGRPPAAPNASTDPIPAATTQVASPQSFEPTPVAARPPRRRSTLGRYTVAVTLLALGGAAILDNLSVVSLTAGRYPAIALAIVATGLLAGAWWGTSRMLIVLGALLVPFAFLGTIVDRPVPGGVGERRYAPAAVQDLRDSYSLSAGNLVVDLRQMRWPADPVTLDAAVGVGQVEIRVPSGVFVKIEGHAGVGEVDFFGQTRNGTDSVLVSSAGPPGAPHHLAIDAQTSIGQIRVVRGGASAVEER